jgi:hypothetical protein
MKSLPRSKPWRQHQLVWNCSFSKPSTSVAVKPSDIDFALCCETIKLTGTFLWFWSSVHSESILSCVEGVEWLIRRVLDWMIDLLTPYTHNSGLQVLQRYRWSTDFTVQRYTRTRVLSSLVVSWQQNYDSLTVTSTHICSLLSTAWFLPCHFFSIIFGLPSTELNPILDNSLKQLSFSLYNHSARTTQKTQPLYCWERLFTGPLPSNERPIVARVRFIGNVFTESFLAMSLYVTLPYIPSS